MVWPRAAENARANNKEDGRVESVRERPIGSPKLDEGTKCERTQEVSTGERFSWAENSGVRQYK